MRRHGRGRGRGRALRVRRRLRAHLSLHRPACGDDERHGRGSLSAPGHRRHRVPRGAGCVRHRQPADGNARADPADGVDHLRGVARVRGRGGAGRHVARGDRLPRRPRPAVGRAAPVEARGERVGALRRSLRVVRARPRRQFPQGLDRASSGPEPMDAFLAGLAAVAEPADPVPGLRRHGAGRRRRRVAGHQRQHHDRAPVAADDHDVTQRGDRVPGIDLLRGQLRRLDHGDPDQHAGRSVGLGHRVRRLSAGQARRGRARARHVRGGERDRRHLQRGRADRGGTDARAPRLPVRPARVFRARAVRPVDGGRGGRRFAGEESDGRRLGRAARDRRPRSHDRRRALHVRRARALGRPRLHSRAGRPVRDGRAARARGAARRGPGVHQAAFGEAAEPCRFPQVRQGDQRCPA